MPMRGIGHQAPSAIQKPTTLVTVAMSVFVKPCSGMKGNWSKKRCRETVMLAH